MSYWIFKIIWMPCLVIVWTAGFGVALCMLKQVGWDAPMRWLALIGLLAFFADSVVNK